MADPINPKDTSGCTEKMDASCIPWNGPAVPCLNICNSDMLEDVVAKEGNLLCQMITDLNTLGNPTTSSIIDFSGLDLKCLWSSTITVWTCPSGQVFVPTGSGTPPGYCGVLGADGTGIFVPGVGWVAAATSAVPVFSTIPNPTPKPTTLLGILQLIISKIPCCDPCATLPRLCCDAPYIWVSPADTGNTTLYPNGACSQTGEATGINPLVLPFKC